MSFLLVPSLDNILSGGGDAWTPAQLAALARIYTQDGSPYYADAINGTQVLRSLEPHGDCRQPRQGRKCMFPGGTSHGVHNSPGFGVFSQLSFSFWLNERVANNDKGFFHIGTFSSSAGPVRALAYSGNFQIGFTGSDVVVARPPIGSWGHVAFTYDGTMCRLYFDGVQVGTSAKTGTVDCTGLKLVIGSYYSVAYGFDGAMRDVRLYNVAKSAEQIAAIAAGEDDAEGCLGHWPMEEESGLTAYNLIAGGPNITWTNITQSTFHATDSGVTTNRNNEHGYKLSSGVYIPKRLNSDLAADGGALSVVGPCPYPVSTSSPCVTGDGSAVYVDLGSALIPATDDFEVSFVLNRTRLNAGDTYVSQSSSGISLIVYGQSDERVTLYLNDGALQIHATANSSDDYSVTVTRSGNDWSISAENQRTGVTTTGTGSLSYSIQSASTNLLRRNAGNSYAAARIANFAITTGGLTKTFPLQDGLGDGTNRNIAYRRSDGTGGVIEGAIVNGTLANVWANRTDKVQDECVLNGGRLAGLNMLTYSEQFDNAAWTKSGVTITPNAEIAPDGTTTMDKWVESSGGSSHVMHQTKTVVSGTVYRFRIYAKAAGNDYIGLYVGTANKGRLFNLATGVAGNAIGNAPDSTSITHVGNGVYRCDITVTATSTSHRFDVYSSKDGTNWDYSGDGTSGVYIWGAQAYAGAADLDYVRTGASTRGNEFVLGLPNSDLCADGLPKTLAAGKFGNPFSRRNLNPFSAAELNGRSIPTELAPGGSLASVTPANSAFMRSADDGDDRLVITVDELTGTNLTKMQAYVA